MPILASDVFIQSQGGSNEGMFECYWCSAPCGGLFRHNDPPPVMGRRNNYLSRRPSSPYVCKGCWTWRWPRVTVNFLRQENGDYKDGQTRANWSWWLDHTGAWAVGPNDCAALYARLLKPPVRFVLMLLDSPDAVNHIQLAVANDNAIVKADTPLFFTIDNKPLSYTIYELEAALRGGVSGREPGVQALVRLLGPHTLPPLPEDPKRGKEVGRPKPLPDAKDTVKKAVTRSGYN